MRLPASVRPNRASSSSARRLDSRALMPYTRPCSTRFSRAGGGQVRAGLLAHHADQAAHARRLADHVEAGHRGLTGVRVRQRREDLHGGRLAGAVRPQQAEHRARLDGQAHAVERAHVAGIRLHEASGLDGVVHTHILLMRTALRPPLRYVPAPAPRCSPRSLCACRAPRTEDTRPRERRGSMLTAVQTLGPAVPLTNSERIVSTTGVIG